MLRLFCNNVKNVTTVELRLIKKRCNLKTSNFRRIHLMRLRWKNWSNQKWVNHLFHIYNVKITWDNKERECREKKHLLYYCCLWGNRIFYFATEYCKRENIWMSTRLMTFLSIINPQFFILLHWILCCIIIV